LPPLWSEVRLDDPARERGQEGLPCSAGTAPSPIAGPGKTRLDSDETLELFRRSRMIRAGSSGSEQERPSDRQSRPFPHQISSPDSRRSQARQTPGRRSTADGLVAWYPDCKRPPASGDPLGSLRPSACLVVSAMLVPTPLLCRDLSRDSPVPLVLVGHRWRRTPPTGRFRSVTNASLLFVASRRSSMFRAALDLRSAAGQEETPARLATSGPTRPGASPARARAASRTTWQAL
jgi:hypothetical protein